MKSMSRKSLRHRPPQRNMSKGNGESTRFSSRMDEQSPIKAPKRHLYFSLMSALNPSKKNSIVLLVLALTL